MRSDADIEETISRHGTAVLRACSAYLPRHDAEDVFQETFLRYAKRSEPFSDDEHRKAWLLRVAINLCKDELRAARRNDEPLDETFSEAAEPAHPPEQDELPGRMRMRDALGELSCDQRTAVLLSVVEGYTAPEVSRIMGRPENTVYSLVRRGKDRLREVLGHDDER